MELKNVNPNGSNVVVSNLINVNFFGGKIVMTKFKIKHHMLFFILSAMIA
jgi:hypothetical protein